MRSMWAAVVGLCVTLVGAAAPAGSVVWLETELFESLGGWTNDAQFIAHMGSPFLLAIGLEGPVQDAVTHAEVPAAGQYRLWVRCHDWVPEYSPGRFQVVLGGKPVEHVFGQNKTAGWVWEDGGTQQLPAGKVEVRLHDLTGQYGRCDAIVLASDPQFVPPKEVPQIAKARIEYGGVSRDVKRLERYDTVVVGGGLAGTFAAVAAARGGCKTALIQDRPVLGGNGSSEVLVNPEGDTTREPLDPGEGGIIEEVRGPVDGYSERMLRLVKKQANLDLLLNTHATGVELEKPGTIAAINAIDVTTKQRLSIPAKIFIDCTGDGEIGVWAGAQWRHGREPRAMYNESRAPEVGDTHTMGGTLRYASQKLTEPVAFKAPDWARHFEECADFNRDRHPKLDFGGWQWIIEYGGMRNTYEDSEEIRDELLRIIWGMWDHAKNHCPKLAAESKNYKLTWVSYVVGKRESRRLIGDYVMTENDIAQKVLFPDRVSYCGWGIDIHPSGGFYDTQPPAIFSHKVKFSVPFRCLYTKDVNNLMMAGRNISVSHVALGATRVMITCGLQGQAVGTAAGLCKLHETLPRELGQNYIGDLQQQLLKDGCYLIDLPNQDPRDMARQATARASSTGPAIKLEMPAQGVHPLTTNRAVMFRVAKDRIGEFSVFLESKNRTPTPVTLTLRPAKELGDFSSTRDLAQAQATVPPRTKGWVKFKLDVPIAPGYHYAMITKANGLYWALFETAPEHTARAWHNGKDWNGSGECYRFAIDRDPKEPSEATADPEPAAGDQMFAAANVVDGFARAIRGVPHAWRPDPKQPLPQWVEIDLGKAAPLNCVHVIFQSKQMRAEDFRVEVGGGDQWRTVADVKENFDRRCVLTFDRTTAAKVRLVITKAKADMGVCELRAYDEPRP